MNSLQSTEHFIFKSMLLLPLYQFISLSEVDNNILSESLTGDGDESTFITLQEKQKCVFSGVNFYLL